MTLTGRAAPLVVAAALAALVACETTRLEETHVVLGWTATESSGCADPPEGETGGVDTFIIDVFAYEGPIEPPGVTASPCRYCAEGQPERARCEHLARRCLCAGERGDDVAMVDAFRGQRYEDVPADRPICVRTVALRRASAPGGPTTGPAEECGDDVSECQLDLAAEAASRARLCALSDLGDLSSSGTPVVMRDIHCRRIEEVTDVCAVPEAPRLCEPLCRSAPGFCVPDLFPVETCAGFVGD